RAHVQPEIEQSTRMGPKKRWRIQWTRGMRKEPGESIAPRQLAECRKRAALSEMENTQLEEHPGNHRSNQAHPCSEPFPSNGRPRRQKGDDTQDSEGRYQRRTDSEYR